MHVDYRIKVGWDTLNGMTLRDLAVNPKTKVAVSNVLSKLVRPDAKSLTRDAAVELSEYLERECG